MAQAVEVSESEAAFLEEAARTISRLAQEVAAIPPRSFLDFGSGWAQQFGPIYDRFQVVLNRAREQLSPGSEAATQFTANAKQFNAALLRAQNEEEDWGAAIARFAMNPIAFQWRAAKSIASAEVEGAAAYAGDAASYVGDKVSEGVGEAAREAGKYGIYALAAAALVGVLLLAGGRR